MKYNKSYIYSKKKIPTTGFEPATPGLEGRCAILLRHVGNGLGNLIRTDDQQMTKLTSTVCRSTN